MAGGSDVKDILDIDSTEKDRAVLEKILAPNQKKKGQCQPSFKRPEGMHRELFALLYADKRDVPPIIPSDTTVTKLKLSGYRNAKANLGIRGARRWIWSPFVNPARKDSLQLHHWVKEDAVDAEYPFARFNKVLESFEYTSEEYEEHLKCPPWTRSQTDHLVDLCKRFDLRWCVIHDRWDRDKFPDFVPSKEDMKERYYDIYNRLSKLRTPEGETPKLLSFDAEHERRRKEQLEKLSNRTEKQLEEEAYLIAELRKIEARRKERERKAQDLQKLITAADVERPGSALGTSGASTGSDKKRKALPSSKQGRDGAVDAGLPNSGIRWPEVKGPGATLRSQRLKFPGNLGQKKTKAIESLLEELGVTLHPPPTDEICEQYNLLRSDLLLLYELRSALAGCQFELESLKHRYFALTGQELEIPANLRAYSSLLDEDSTTAGGGDGDETSQTASSNVPALSPLKRKLDEVLELSGSSSSSRKRRTASIDPGGVNIKKMKRN